MRVSGHTIIADYDTKGIIDGVEVSLCSCQIKIEYRYYPATPGDEFWPAHTEDIDFIRAYQKIGGRWVDAIVPFEKWAEDWLMNDGYQAALAKVSDDAIDAEEYRAEMRAEAWKD
jgi:hypothetical protein